MTTKEEHYPIETKEPERVLLQIAQPMASEKTEQLALGIMSRFHLKKMLCRGVKEVKKSFKRQQKGILLLAADTFPSQIIAAFPALANQRQMPFLFLNSRAYIAKAAGLRDSVVAVLVKEDLNDKDYMKLYDKAKQLYLKMSGVKTV